MEDKVLKRTPLFDRHVSLGAKMVPFAGWEMPVLYKGLIEEHQNTRQNIGLFDVSHMGEILVTGPQAQVAIDYMTCNDLSLMYNGRAQYNAIINPKGGVVDDIILLRMSPEKFFICVNASNTDKAFEWFQSHNTFQAKFENLSSNFGQIAIQGPRAKEFVDKLFSESISSKIFYYHFEERKLKGADVIVARTGYTGEDGFEILIPKELTVEVWDLLLDLGSDFGAMPIGLGARDTLRLEACYPLHGHEMGDDITAIESGLGRIVKPEKGNFIGRDVLASQKESGAPRALVAFVVDDPGIVREQSQVFDEIGNDIGVVTSGTKTPTVGVSLGMALIKTGFSKRNSIIYAEVRGRKLKCHVVPKPFYRTTTPPPSVK